MILAILAALSIVAPVPRAAVGAAEARTLTECVAAFEALHAADDRAGCVALWRANPHWVAVALASDVEGVFAELETGRKLADVEGRLARSLWGARRAADAGQPLVADYVASLAGLDEYRRSLYRQAQKIYERATQTVADGQHELAVGIAHEAVERATDLGDWWGAAMAHATLGECHRALGSFDDALIAFAQARNLYQGLGLVQNEQHALISMATMAGALELDVRGRELVYAGLRLGERLETLVPDYDDRTQRIELLRLLAGMETRLGDDAAAAAARAEMKALEAR